MKTKKLLKSLTAVLLSAIMCVCTAVPVFAVSEEVRIGTNTFCLNKHYDEGLKPCFAGEGYCMISIWSGQNPIRNEKKVPSDIPETIEGYPVICLREAFMSNDQEGTYGAVVSSPKIPKYVKDMEKTFVMSQISTPPTIPDSVINLKHTFKNCKNMRSFPTLGKNIKDMEYAFSGCNAAKGNVLLPTRVENISYAFSGCESLSEIPDLSKLCVLKNTCATFMNCKTAIGGTDLPNSGLTDINYMFLNCTKMSKAPKVILSSVKTMQSTFEGCQSLTGTIDVRASITKDNKNSYSSAFKGVATEPECELILNYTAENECAIDDIIATKLITSNIKKGVLLGETNTEEPENPDVDDNKDEQNDESNGTAPVVPEYKPLKALPVTEGRGHQEVKIEGIVEPINTIDVDVPVNLQFVIDEKRYIHYTQNAKVISRSPAPLAIYSKGVTVPTGAPKLVANDSFDDWDNLNIQETKSNIAISLNDKNLSENGVKLGNIDSAFSSETSLPLRLSVLYGKQWVNTSRLVFDYAMNLELALEQ